MILLAPLTLTVLLDTSRENEAKIEQLAYLLKSKQLSDEVKRTAAAAAIAAAREEGIRAAAAAGTQNQDSDFTFAVGPDDPRHVFLVCLKKTSSHLVKIDSSMMGDWRKDPSLKFMKLMISKLVMIRMMIRTGMSLPRGQFSKYLFGDYRRDFLP